MGRLQKIFPEMGGAGAGGGGGIPQAKPLSAGETLGCTAPVIQGADCLVFVADGRFHLEAGEAVAVGETASETTYIHNYSYIYIFIHTFIHSFIHTYNIRQYIYGAALSLFAHIIIIVIIIIIIWFGRNEIFCTFFSDDSESPATGL